MVANNDKKTSSHVQAPTEFLATGPDSKSLPTWYVAYTQARQEHVAAANLEWQHYNVYLPLFKTIRKAARRNDERVGAGAQDPVRSAPHAAHEAMFPRYVFFQPRDAKQSIGPVKSTRGVSFVLMFGGQPATIQEPLIQEIRALEELRNRASLETLSPFQPGRRARLVDPRLSGLEGLIQAVSKDRVTLLLSILGRDKTVQVDHQQLELVGG